MRRQDKEEARRHGLSRQVWAYLSRKRATSGDLPYPPWWVERPDGSLEMTAIFRCGRRVDGPRFETRTVVSTEMVRTAAIDVLELLEQDAIRDLRRRAALGAQL